MTSPKSPKVIKKKTEMIKPFIQKHRSTIINSSILIVSIVLITILVAPSSQSPIKNYKEGDIARETVRINDNISITDLDKTNTAKREAETAVISIYDHDETLIGDSINKIESAFKAMREFAADEISPLKKVSGPYSDEIKQKWLAQKKQFDEIAGFESSESVFWTFAINGFSQKIESKLKASLFPLEKRLIIGDMTSLKNDISKGIVLKNIDESKKKTKYIKDFSNVFDLEHAKNFLKDRARPILQGFSPKLRRAILEFANRFVGPNVFINMNLTSAKVEEARQNVKSVTIPLQQGEVVFREGDRITKRHAIILEGLKQAHREISSAEIKFGIIIISVLIILLTYLFAKTYIRKFNPSTRDLIVLLSTTVFTILLANILMFLSNALEDQIPILSSPTFRFAIPVAASAMLIRFALNSETAIIFSFVMSMLMGYIFDANIGFAIYCFVGSIFGAYKIAYSKTKFDLMKAGLMTGLINALTAIALQMIGGKVFSGGYTELGLIVFMAVMSGVFIALILPTLSTLVEAAGYLTDIKLIELSNFNNPLLNKLALVAPGTYHHSRVVAQLSEVAAGSVHANPLLSQVLAFYHDIGKIKQPEYFIENQGTGENKHDDLKPSMSKMILIKHVKDGVDLAKEQKVPKEIIDAIEQHHGTSLISFFYKKAKDQENEEVDQIDESEYRYPGPKPQTREIGLLMLADAVEAASKSLADPTPAQLQGVIQKVFNKTFTDGQLEDCELTLKDLHRIAASFFRVLVSIYKARIDYPEIPSKDANKKKENGDTHTKQTKEDKAKNHEDKEGDKGNLKRIGIEK